MKYISLKLIKQSLQHLKPHHSFFGVTFFVLKKQLAPIGQTARFRLDANTESFLTDHYRIHPQSKKFFKVFRQRSNKKDWVKPDYASSGLQTINTQTFKSALLHDPNDNTWGWSDSYISELKKFLPAGKKLPLLYVAAWLYKGVAWPDDAGAKSLIQTLIQDYSLTEAELDSLFDVSVGVYSNDDLAFQEKPVSWEEILKGYSIPDDVPPVRSGVLSYLELAEIGPLRHLKIEPSTRLNIFTGDNGLGKTFILDLAWWSLTRHWVGHPAWPADPSTRSGTVKFIVSASTPSRVQRAEWDPKLMEWNLPKQSDAVSGLVIYARVDGSFAVWDPMNRRNMREAPGPTSWPGDKFTWNEVWNGTDRIEGLIRDWVKWQEQSKHAKTFNTFSSVLKRVSPPDLGPLRAGEPRRLPNDVRDIPTLVHPYGTVPVVFASAGIKRILTLAYLIVWAWEEHKVHASLSGKKQERQMVVLIDEVEAHLHPRWQRVILPALMGIASDLHPDLAMQMFVGTHSPLVLASSEPVFNEDMDSLFHLELMAGGRIEAAKVAFDARGGVDSWLESDVFKVRNPGSKEREDAIQYALSLQRMSNPSKADIENATQALRNFLPPEDSFWPRWVFFADSFGVEL